MKPEDATKTSQDHEVELPHGVPVCGHSGKAANDTPSGAGALICDAFECLSEGFVIYDANDRLVMCNEAYRQLYHENASAFTPGAHYEAIMRTALATGRYPEAIGREEEWLAEWMKKHRESDASTESHLRDGRWVLVSERRMADGGIVGLRIDITALKAVQASLGESQRSLSLAKEAAEDAKRQVQSANAELERRVKERTEELRAAQEELLAAERLSTIGQITATVAHELRNPLSAIRNSVFVLKQIAEQESINVDRPVSRMERSLGRCNRLVDDLLSYSRQSDLRLSTRSFDGWLAEVIGEQTAPSGVCVVLELCAGETRVSFDADRLRQVVINLFDNAIQAMENEPAIDSCARLKSCTRRMGNGEIEFTMEDSGPGITSEHLTKVFQPLFSTKSFGTGLGLPTVKRIVEQHRGTINIVSEPGNGTRVVVHLPIADLITIAQEQI